jgi:poly(3-hydroxybutyrate) depolymerase
MGNRATEPLRRGNAFHARVQTAFLAGLLGAEAAPERPVTLSLSRSGRVDLLVPPRGGEVAAVVVEITEARPFL